MVLHIESAVRDAVVKYCAVSFEGLGQFSSIDNIYLYRKILYSATKIKDHNRISGCSGDYHRLISWVNSLVNIQKKSRPL